VLVSRIVHDIEKMPGGNRMPGAEILARFLGNGCNDPFIADQVISILPHRCRLAVLVEASRTHCPRWGAMLDRVSNVSPHECPPLIIGQSAHSGAELAPCFWRHDLVHGIGIPAESV